MGRGEPYLDVGSMGGSASYWNRGGVGGGVQGHPDPGSGLAGEAYGGEPLFLIIESQATASSEQKIKSPTLSVGHKTSLDKWHALSVGRGLVKPTRLWNIIRIGDSAASDHCTGGCAYFYNKRPSTSDETFLSIGDGKRMELELFGRLGVVVHGADEVTATLRNVTFVPGVPFDLFSLNVIREEHVITLGHNRAHMINGRASFRKEKFGNYVEATRAASHKNPPALVAVLLRPGDQIRIDVDDLNCSFGHAHDVVLRERLIIKLASR